uniref:F-box domain-containing protein n=1 Tax=Moniliophthora roreri TaxID=221103 RepID=A0A0W0EXJ5_MONRR
MRSSFSKLPLKASKKTATTLSPAVSSSIIIPSDIILEIAKWLSARDLLRVSLQSKHIFSLLQSSLYASVKLDHADACRSNLKRFRKRSDLTKWIKVIDLRLIQRSGWSTNTERGIDEDWAALMVQQMASEGSLPLLNTFKWQGLESPNNSLWLALRSGCPLLRVVGTTVGKRTHLIGSDSHLFDFRELEGFHLSTLILERWEGESDTLPQRLWDMLLSHSPDLEELTLNATVASDDVWILSPLLKGRWPKLRRLSIGNLFKEIGDPKNGELFIEFLTAHPTLEEFDSYGNDWLSPSAKLHDILGNLPHLESLSICVNFIDKQQGSQQNFFERLLKECTNNLQNLAISSTSPLNLRDLFNAMVQARNLNLSAIYVTRVRNLKLNDTDVKVAIQVAEKLQHLKEFVIRDVSNWDHYDQLSGIYRTKTLRRFIILSGGRVRVQENGMGSLGQKYSKSSMYSLSVTG